MMRLIWRQTLHADAPSQQIPVAAAGGMPRPLSDDSIDWAARPRAVDTEGPVDRRKPLRFHALLDDVDEVAKAVALLSARPDVSEIELEKAVEPPPLAAPELGGPCTPSLRHFGKSRDWRPCQRYLDPAPLGLDARHAWTFLGGRGDGVSLVDLETGFQREHEDLQHVRVRTASFPSDPHGTMSLGVCCGDDRNDFGISGVAPAVTAWFDPVAEDDTFGTSYPLVARAIQAWARRLCPGSVILLELNVLYYEADSGVARWYPLERYGEVREAIAEAADKNIYVIEPAGNGEVDLDAVGMTERTRAIMVAGGVPGQHTWDGRSNHGSRVDVQGWGQGVVSAASSEKWATLQKPTKLKWKWWNHCYTQSFNGTSSAAAMVAGAVACLSGILKANGIDPPDPAYMRNLLVCTGTPEPADTTERIGPLPDLRRAIARMEIDFGKKFRPATQAAA